jgi:hypothetical protein
MAWIFALGVLALAVYHRGFRKVLLWGSPVWLAIAISFTGS